MKIHVALIFLFCCSCNETKLKIILPDLQSGKKETPMAIKQYPPRICGLIDELGLCRYLYCETKECCYDIEGPLDFYPIRENDTTMNYFLVRTPGGSGGDGVAVYKKESGKFIQIQDEFVFFDTVLSEVTNGFYNIRLWHRDYSRGYIHVLYQWNGKKYEPTEVIGINGIPMKMLTAMKIAKSDIGSKDFVKEYTGVSNTIYFELVIDTLIQTYETSIYTVIVPNWQKTQADKCWIIQQTGNEFVLSAVAGTSAQTYVQDESGKKNYKTILK